MLGLMKKEIFMMKNYMATAGIVMLILTIAMISSENAEIGILSGYIVAFTAISPITMIAYDEKNKWDRYSSAMPATKRQQVLCKYLMVILIIVILTAIFIALCAIKGETLIYIKGVTIIPVVMAITISGIELLMAYKFGANKARFVLIGIMFLIIFGARIYGAMDMLSVITKNPAMFYIGGIIVAFAIYIASFCLSVHFHSNKDF